jgi:superfamily II DNA or RNA helicase
MSVPVLKSSLSEKQQKLIRKLLVINPKVLDRRSFKMVPSGKTFHCWVNEEDHYCLPFAFAFRLLNEDIHDYEGDWKKINVPFVGQLRDYQEHDTRQAEELLDEEGCALLAVYASAGKTLQSTYLATRKGYQTLILYHRKPLRASWMSTMQEFFPSACVIDVDKKTKTEDLSRSDIILCMEKRFKYIPESVRYQIGTLIVDEAHEWYTTTRVIPILYFHPRYLILATATPDKVDGTDDVLKLLIGTDRVYRICEKPFTVIKYLTKIVPDTGRWTDVIEGLTLNEERNDLIVRLACEKYRDEKIIMLSEREEHVIALVNKLRDLGESIDYMAGNKSSYRECRILLGTMSKIGTGFDPRTVCENFDGTPPRVLFILTSIKGHTRLEQCVGRVFRADDPLVVHLVDENDTIKTHWRQCTIWYKKRNSTILIQKNDQY